MRIFVPSRDRPGNVPRMERLAGGAKLVWLVPEEQEHAYRRYGATEVVTGHPRKSHKMNEALDRFNDDWCVFSDDDCSAMFRLGTDLIRRRITLEDAAVEFVAIGERRQEHLVNMICLHNAKFINLTLYSWGRATGWFFAVAPGTECRFDESLPYCEDLDFAARCFDRYGGIAIPGWILGHYRMGDPNSHFRNLLGESDFRPLVARLLITRYPHLFRWDGGLVEFTRALPPVPKKRLRSATAPIGATRPGTASRGRKRP